MPWKYSILPPLRLRVIRRHLAQADPVQTEISLREGLLRPRRDGKPDQGMPARSLCRSHLDQHDAAKLAAPLVRLDGLRATLRIAADRALPRACQRQLPIRLKLLKIGALVRTSCRRVKIAKASGCPAASVWGDAAARLNAAGCARGSPA
jgi:hypothetical protein